MNSLMHSGSVSFQSFAVGILAITASATPRSGINEHRQKEESWLKIVPPLHQGS